MVSGLGEPSGGASTSLLYLAQTFTVGLEGRLSTVELYAFLRVPGTRMEMQIRRTDEGWPASTDGILGLCI